MNRRNFVTIGSVLAAFPAFAAAQARTPLRIGFITFASVSDLYLEPFRAALRERLHGRHDGAPRGARARARSGARSAARDLVDLQVHVIVSVFTVGTATARRATSSIAIVFLGVADPVGTGIVASMNRPGGNVTGIGHSAAEANAKTFELLSEALPAARHVEVITDPGDPYAKILMDRRREAGKKRLLDIHALAVPTHEALDSAVADVTRHKPDAVIIQGSFPSRTAALLLKHGIPSGATSESSATAGSLVCYAVDVADTCRKGADYVQRITRGAKPADLPVQVPKRNVVLNIKTARALGISIPQALLVRADRLIE